MEYKKENYDYGVIEEKKQIEIIEKHFNIKLNHKIDDRYCLYDYKSICKNIYLEIKSRRNTKLKYPDTMIGFNKIRFFKKKLEKNKKVILIFNFTDKICYYELKEINKDYIKFFRGVKYYYINTKELIDF